ncbi:hypothetical protein MFLAVUS_005124 [Mucor flavus]|uniref:Uncharacterized protein n=1 Tax=Mucor flavus TaxID=439312 RepID=A0ABP9YXV9_9FUNG
MSPHAFAASEEEFQDIARWLVTGEILSNDLPPKYSSEEILRRLVGRRSSMEARVKKNKNDGSKLVSPEELFRICTESRFEYAISGHSVHIHSPRQTRTPYWARTLDRVNPLHEPKVNPASWSGDNIQLLSSVLNSVKNDNSNEELIRWYADFMRSLEDAV